METAKLCAKINNIIKKKQFQSPLFDAVCKISASECSENSKLFFDILQCHFDIHFFNILDGMYKFKVNSTTSSS